MNNELDLFQMLRDNLRQQLGASSGDDAEATLGLKTLDPEFADFVDLEVVEPEAGSNKPETRLTFSTPGNNTTFSLGAAASSRQTDEGIFGRTDQHIMLEVTKETPTFVSLGGKSTYGAEIGSLGLTSRSAVGYAMVTDGDAWHESGKRHYLLARDGDLIARACGGGEVLLQSDEGEGTVSSGGNLHVATQSSLSLLAAPDLALEHPDYQENVTGEVASTVERKVLTWTHTIFDQAQVIYGCLIGAKTLKQLPIPGRDGFLPYMATGVTPLMLDTMKGMYWLLTQFSDAPNSATMAADGGVAVAGEFATLWGTTGAGVGSLVSADVVGGTAGVKAATYAGLWAGVAASIEGTTQVSVSARLGDVEIEARKEVRIGSKKGDVLVGSENGVAQISGKTTYVHGGDNAQLTSGTGAGFGVFVTPGTLQLGRVASDMSTFSSASCENKLGMMLKKTQLLLQMDKSKLDMKQSKVDLHTSGNVEIKAKKVKVNGKKVLLA